MTPNKPDSDRVVKMKQALLLDGHVSRSPFPDWLKIVGDISYNEMWKNCIEPHHIRSRNKNQPELDDVKHLISLNRVEHDWVEGRSRLKHPQYGEIKPNEFMWLILKRNLDMLPSEEYRWRDDLKWLRAKITNKRLRELSVIIYREVMWCGAR